MHKGNSLLKSFIYGLCIIEDDIKEREAEEFGNELDG